MLTACTDAIIVDGRYYRLTPPDDFIYLETAKSCCKSFSDFQYKTLLVDQTNYAKIDSKSQAYEFDSGKSFFIAYKIPEIVHPFQITIKSYYSGAGFYPSALVLNDRFSVLRLIANPEFSYVPSGFIEEDHIGGTITIENSKKEQYLVIFTRPKEMKLETFTDTSGTAYATSTGITVIPARRAARDYGPVGNLEISIMKE